jgi:hypothetical protein
MPESKMPRLPSSLLAEVADMLVRLIPPQVRSLNIGETVYSLRIWYHGSDSFTSDWTPWLMLPKESVRQQALAERKNTAPHYIWCADELTSPNQTIQTGLEDPRLVTSMRAWYDGNDWETGSDADKLRPIREMVEGVCARLNALNWRQYAPVTDDFIVFPADSSHTFGDYAQLVASVPAERIQLLRDRGFLGGVKWYELDSSSGG